MLLGGQVLPSGRVGQGTGHQYQGFGRTSRPRRFSPLLAGALPALRVYLPQGTSAQATSPPYNTTSGKLALLSFWPPTGVTPLSELPAEKLESPPSRGISLIRLLSPPGRIVEILNNFHCCSAIVVGETDPRVTLRNLSRGSPTPARKLGIFSGLPPPSRQQLGFFGILLLTYHIPVGWPCQL